MNARALSFLICLAIFSCISFHVLEAIWGQNEKSRITKLIDNLRFEPIPKGPHCGNVIVPYIQYDIYKCQLSLIDTSCGLGAAVLGIAGGFIALLSVKSKQDNVPAAKKQSGRMKRRALVVGPEQVSMPNVCTRVLSWPLPHEYSEAMQNIRHSALDEDIKQGDLQLDRMGLPKVVSGNFASVYRLHLADKDIALRCFSNPVSDEQERYSVIGRCISAESLSPSLVKFDYLKQGILIARRWFPLLKMEWVEGESIHSFLWGNSANPDSVRQLRVKFAKLMAQLACAGAAHGDLQDGNLLIRNKELVLVDYDGMFVPALAGYPSREIGHPNYQHPGRGAQHFGPYLDHFSAWVIDTALLVVENDGELWSKYGSSNESLLFRQADYLHPDSSAIFAELEQHHISQISQRAGYLKYLLSLEVEMVPRLSPAIWR